MCGYLIILTVIETMVLVGANVEVQIKYKVCNNKITHMWKRESEKAVKSMKMCGILCSRLPWCRAITACPVSTGGYNCQFHYGIFYATCESFRPDPNCKMMIETTTNMAPVSVEGCKNGGIWQGSKCECLDGFASSTCDRYIKDCDEGTALGCENKPGEWDYVSTMMWPTGAPYPFETLCNFKDGKAIMFFRHIDVPMNWNRTLDEYKYIFTVTNEAYWMGLEHIHYFTNSGAYQMQIYFFKLDDTPGQIFYKNFRLGSENTGYELGYSSLTVERPSVGMSDGSPDCNTLGPVSPWRPFCTWEQPGCNSAVLNGGWWHDGFATQYSLTKANQPIYILYFNNDVQVKSVSFQIFGNARL